MSFYYPQSAVTLDITWEDFGRGRKLLDKSYSVSCVPRQVSVNLSDYTQADTFSCELDYKYFPFDPRTIRACNITIHMENTRNQVSQIVPRASNAMFIGFADEDTIDLDEENEVVRLEGRDYTGLLIDRPYVGELGQTIQFNKPADDIIRDLLQALPQTKNIQVVNMTGGPLPVLANYAVSKTPGAPGNHRSTVKDDHYWDIVQDIANRCGVVAYIQLDKLLIRTPRAMYSGSKSKQLIYGKNLKKLSFKRKLGRMRGFNIKVTSLTPEGPVKEPLTAKIPEEATPEWCKSIGIDRKPVIAIRPVSAFGAATAQNQTPEAAPYFSISIPNIASKDHLVQIGQKVFEEYGRQQIEGSLETKDMLLAEGLKDPVEFDILKLRIADPILVEIDMDDLEHVKHIATAAARRSFLIRAGYEPQVADAFAATFDMKYNSFYYTKSIKFSIGKDEGFSCSIDFMNFVEIAQAKAGA